MEQCIVDGCNKDKCIGRYCREHYLARKREKAKLLYQKTGGYKYTIQCELCGKIVQTRNKTQSMCLECYRRTKNTGYTKNSYTPAGGNGYCWKHRRIAEETLGRKLSSNEIVHHMDCNPTNNSTANLIVISRSKHAALHIYLQRQRALLLKDSKMHDENCWNNLIVPMTTTWLETAGVKVIKLWEIGQSAAEPLKMGKVQRLCTSQLNGNAC